MPIDLFRKAAAPWRKPARDRKGAGYGTSQSGIPNFPSLAERRRLHRADMHPDDRRVFDEAAATVPENPSPYSGWIVMGGTALAPFAIMTGLYIAEPGLATHVLKSWAQALTFRDARAQTDPAKERIIDRAGMPIPRME